jgi:putative endonuclease
LNIYVILNEAQRSEESLRLKTEILRYTQNDKKSFECFCVEEFTILLTLSHRRRVPKSMVRQYQYFVYIMTNKSGTLYTGVTNNLERRIYEHKHHLVKGFTNKYNIDKLVYFEETNDINAAISREKQIKGWLRKKKIALIESINPGWKDLSQ